MTNVVATDSCIIFDSCSSASQVGGAIFLLSDSTMSDKQSQYLKNQASMSGGGNGGAIYHDST